MCFFIYFYPHKAKAASYIFNILLFLCFFISFLFSESKKTQTIEVRLGTGTLSNLILYFQEDNKFQNPIYSYSFGQLRKVHGSVVKYRYIVRSLSNHVREQTWTFVSHQKHTRKLLLLYNYTEDIKKKKRYVSNTHI